MATPATKLLVAACSIQAAVILALGWLIVRGVPVQVGQASLEDPRVRDRVVAALVDRVGGAYDSHNDPQVARVLLKNLRGRSHGPVAIDTNRFGLRERDYAIPKPASTLRVVLLGDSFVFGTGCPQDERMGRHLEGFLRERSGNPDIEVLHLGIMSWNLVAECSYLRRQLSLLQPDLVFHLSVPNDLDDMEGVRGFGGLSRFSPTHRDRGPASIRLRHPGLIMGTVDVQANTLIHNHDWESRTRFDAARRAIDRLVAELDRTGARYVHLFRWPKMGASMRAVLGAGLRDDQVAYLADAFLLDESTWVAPDDMHWGPKGMRQMALLYYGLIQERGLLPELELPAWGEAREAVARIHRAARNDPSLPTVRATTIDATLDLETPGETEATHVHGGVDADGFMMPFAALSLRNARAQRLRIRGRPLDRPEIDGATVRVHVDGIPTGRFQLTAGVDVDVALPLPLEVAARPHVTVWLQSDDWAYGGDDLQKCLAMRLHSVGLEP